MTVHTLFPTDADVSEEAVIGWAYDRMLDDLLEEAEDHGNATTDEERDWLLKEWQREGSDRYVPKPTLEEAMTLLSDRGLVTFRK